MTTHRSRFLVTSLAICAALAAASWLAAQGRRESPDPDSMYKYLSVFSEVLSRVREAYVHEPEVQQLMGGAYEGTADALGAFAVYVPAEQVAEYRRATGERARETGLLMVRERGWVYVAGVEEGSLAKNAGFERGDLVAKVDGEPTRTLQVWQIEAHLARHSGRDLPVTVMRRGEEHALVLTAEGTATAAGAAAAPGDPRVAMRQVDGVPVLRVGRFVPATVAAVERELAALARAGTGKLVVDLRGVAGGETEVAFAVADLLLAGEMGALKSRGTVRERFTARGEPVWRGRLVVLIDRGTLGAAEVLAAALDQGAQATLVGEESFGHAGRQAQVQLSSGAVLELTDAFYAGPNGEPIDDGLEPDLDVDERSRRLGERELTVDELILRRGIGVLTEEEVKKAA